MDLLRVIGQMSNQTPAERFGDQRQKKYIAKEKNTQSYQSFMMRNSNRNSEKCPKQTLQKCMKEICIPVALIKEVLLCTCS